MSWWERASCRELVWWLEDPPRDYAGVEHHWSIRRDVCRGCQVLSECRSEARVNDEPVGMWGGETPEERAVHAAKVARCVCGVVFTKTRAQRIYCSQECFHRARSQKDRTGEKPPGVAPCCGRCGEKLIDGQCRRWECLRARRRAS